jgi:hypothetical protein
MFPVSISIIQPIEAADLPQVSFLLMSIQRLIHVSISSMS